MNTRLITPDGFPRADLDVAQSNYYMHYLFSIKLIKDKLGLRDRESYI